MTVLLPTGSPLVPGAAAGPALASDKLPPPIRLPGAPSLMGAAPVDGAGALPSLSRAGVADGHIQPSVVKQPGAGGTLTLISATVSPRLCVVPQWERPVALPVK